MMSLDKIFDILQEYFDFRKIKFLKKIKFKFKDGLISTNEFTYEIQMHARSHLITSDKPDRI